MLSLVDHRDNARALIHVADHPVSAAYGRMTDVRGHSPQGGLPLFYRETSGIASEGSYVRINKDKLRIPGPPRGKGLKMDVMIPITEEGKGSSG